MANYSIDLSANNTLASVTMGVGDTMVFTSTGTGGGAGEPIKVTGNFTMTGGTITLRSNTNLTPGSVTKGGITKNLNTTPGTSGGGGSGGRAGGQYVYSFGGSGGVNGSAGSASGSNGGFGTVEDSPFNGGAYPGGAGTTRNSRGGGGGAGAIGTSNEAVCFYVGGNISITGGTIAGAAGNGGTGGAGGNGTGDPGGGGGGGGAGGSGGRLFFIYIGTQTESGVTKTLAAGTGGSGGPKGSGYYDSYDSTAGTAGGTGTAGYTEYTKSDTTPDVGTLTVSSMFENQIDAFSSINSNGGNTITEMGFVTGANINPTTGDTKHTVTVAQSGAFTKTIMALTASTGYHIRAFATNSKGTTYSNDIGFTTLESFWQKTSITM